MARSTTATPRKKAATTASPARPVVPDRVAKYPRSTAVVQRKVWILGCEPKRLAVATEFLNQRGHIARSAEPGGDVGGSLRADRPDLVVIDMQSDPERGRHLAVQLRADRGTRQLPIVMVGVSSADGPKVDRAVPGPTRRYAGTLDSETVLEAIYKDL
jgi:CheY-like chemotaxis protein